MNKYKVGIAVGREGKVIEFYWNADNDTDIEYCVSKLYPAATFLYAELQED